jgi:hypothetical protein
MIKETKTLSTYSKLFHTIMQLFLYPYASNLLKLLMINLCRIPTITGYLFTGMFFQWMFGISIGIYSLIVAQVRGNPTFYPLTMLGGALFITGEISPAFFIFTKPLIICNGKKL